MEPAPTSGISIAQIARELDVPAQRALEATWSLHDVAAFDTRTLLTPQNAERVRAALASVPRQAERPKPQPATRTHSGLVIPKPAPPTSEYARQQALMRYLGNSPADTDESLEAMRRRLGINPSAATARPRPAPHPARRQPHRQTTPRRQPALAAVVQELKARYPWHNNADAAALAERWVTKLLAEPKEIFAWWEAGYGPTKLEMVIQLHTAGIRSAHLLDVTLDHDTVRQLLKRDVPVHFIARLLRDGGYITDR